MSQLIPLVMSLDGTQAKATITDINRRIQRLGKVKTKSPLGFDKRNVAQLEKQLKNSNNKILNDRKRVAERIKGFERQELEAKKSSLRKQEAAVKQFNQLQLISTKKQVAAASRASKEASAKKAHERKLFIAAERAKTRMAEVQAKKRTTKMQQEFRKQEAGKRREKQAFERMERQKSVALNQQARNRAQLGQNIQTAGQSVTRIGIGVTAAVTLPIVAATAAILKMGAEYETAMNTFQATSRATATDMELASKAAIKLGNDLTLPGVSAADAGDAMLELSKGGLSVQDSINAATGALRLSKAANIESAQSAFIMASALNQFQLEGKEAARVADLFAAAATSASGGPIELSEGLKNVGTAASSMNNTIEDTISLLAIFAKNGILGADAGTALRMILVKLAAPTDRAKTQLDLLGVTIFELGSGKMRKAFDILKDFSKATADLSDQQKLPALVEIFGQKSAVKILPLLRGGIDAFDEMKKSVTRVNAAQELSAARTKGLAGAWEAMVSTLETVGLQIFDFIKVPVTKLLFFLANSINTIAELFGNLPKSVKVIAIAIVGLVASIGPLLVIIGTLLTLVGAVMATITAAGGIGVILAGIGIAIAAVTGILLQLTPVLILVGVQIALTVKAWQEDFGGLRTFITDTFEAIKSFITLAMDFILENTRLIGGQIIVWWRVNYPLIRETVINISNAIKTFIQRWIKLIQTLWTSHGKGIMNIVRVAWGFIRTHIQLMIKQIGLFLTLGMQLINGKWDEAWDTYLKITSNATVIVINIVKGAMTNLWNVIKTLLPFIITQAIKIQSTALVWATKIVVGIVDIIADLPFQIIKLVPIMVAAGMAIGQAIWEGIKQSLVNSAATVDSKILRGSFDLPDDAEVVLPHQINAFRRGPISTTGTSSASKLAKSLLPSPFMPSIGSGISKGGGGGGRSKAGKASKTKTLTPIEQLRKSARDAGEELAFLNSSLEVLELKAQIIKTGNIKSLAEELINLRIEVGADQLSLPTDKKELQERVNTIKESINIAKDGNKLQDKMKASVMATAKATTFYAKTNVILNRALANGNTMFTDQQANQFLLNATLADQAEEKRKLAEFESKLIDKANQTITQLDKELELFGKTDVIEKTLIENKHALLALRSQMFIDGFSVQSVDSAEKELLANQAIILVLRKKLALKTRELELQKEIEAITKFGKGLENDLNRLRVFNKELTTYEKTLKDIAENYKNISPEQKKYLLDLAKQIDAQKIFNEEVKRTEDFLRSVFDVLLDTTQSFGDRLKRIFDNILLSFKQMITDMLTAWLTSKLFGISTSTSGGGPSGGGGAGGILGSIFNKIFKPTSGGGVSVGPGGTAPTFPSTGVTGTTIPNAVITLSNVVSQSLKNTLTDVPLTITTKTSGGGTISGTIGGATGGAAGGIGGKLSLSSIGKTLGQLAPLLGLSLGGLAGGSSGIGQILGSAGGLLGGLVIGASVGAIGGSLGSLFALSGLLGPAAAIAAPLLILGGFLLGRNKQRRADETTRNQLSLDSFAQIDQLIKDVNLDRIDGQSALAQANSIRQNYLVVAGGLKDKKTRNIALSDVSRVDSRIATLRTAVSSQEHRQEVGSQLTPEFKHGGIFDTASGRVSRFNKILPRNFSGKVPGSFDGRDDVLLAVSQGERVMILNPSQQLDFSPTGGGLGSGVTVVIETLVLEVDAGVNPELITLEGLKVKSVENFVVNKTITRLKDG